jgi:tetratricopeptide (TPR) repeat protein
LLIVGVTLWIYWPSLQGALIWDDQWYITMNPLLHDSTGLWKFWFQPGSWVEYYPVQESVLWLQWQLWGEDTLGYHLTNLGLHLVSAFLVWSLLSKFGLRFAWLGGLIFAVHPVQVESVAYICELKNTLSLPFFLLAMGKWIDYEESKAKRDYGMALGLFTVAMLGKITMAPFPAVILLYAWWKRGRIGWGDLKACGPFLLVALVLGYTTIWAGQVYNEADHNLIPGTPLGGILSRIDAVGLIGSVYFARCFLPVDILLIYPQWPLHPHSLMEYLPWLVLVGVLGALWTRRHGWGRHVFLGLGFFLIILSPFLGLIGVSYMNFIWVMDHFLYIPIIGLIGLVVAGAEDLAARSPAWFRPFGLGIIAAALALMAWVGHGFASLFVNEQTLWTYVLQRNPTVWLAHEDLACKLMELDRYPEAMAQEKEALKLRPDYADSYYNLALDYEKQGQAAEAEAEYHEALRHNPSNPKIYLNLGQMKRHAGNLSEAEALFRQGMKVAPEDASLCTDLAGILEQTGRVPEAIALYEKTLQHNPDFAQLQYDLGTALLQNGNPAEAEEHLEAALTLDPKIASAHENLGTILAQKGALPDAIEQFAAAVQLDPGYLVARNNLGLALAQSGRMAEAIDQFQQVLAIDPGNATARGYLSKIESMSQGAAAK